MDLPPIEELRILVAWFKQWYGLCWETRTEQAAHYRRGYITNRLHGSTTISRNFLNRLSDVRASLLFNTRA